MKYLSILVAGALALSACSHSKETTTESEGMTASDSLRIALADQDSLLALFNEVSDGMTQIKQLENLLNSSNDLNSPETQDRRQQIRNDMMLIQQTLQSRRQRLEELEKKLASSASSDAQLRKTIQSLKNQIASQESAMDTLRSQLNAANIHIDKLTATVDTLNNTVATVTAAKEVVEQEATNLSNELNTCYFALGSKKELKEHNLIETGFLRKTKIMPEDYEQSYFTRADKRNLTTIDLHSKKAKVLTNQPSDSYTITDNPTGSKVLTITNPTRFWNTSNFLIVQID